MPRYFFNVTDGLAIPDRDGTELADDARACAEALRMAGQIITFAGEPFWAHGLTLDVVDPGGRSVCRLTFAGWRDGSPG